MRAFKRVLLWLLFVAVLCAVLIGGVLLFLYQSTDAEPEIPRVSLGGQVLSASGVDWHAPVLGGLFYKSYQAAAGVVPLEPFSVSSLDFSVPEAGACEMSIYRKGDPVAVVSSGSSGTFSLPVNGDYTIRVRYTSVPDAADRGRGYGTFTYEVDFTLDVEPSVDFSAQSLKQGGVLAVNVSGILDGSAPEIETDLSQAVFVETEKGLTAFVGIAYNREPGDYRVRVTCGDLCAEHILTVVHRDYDSRTVADATDPSGSVTEWQNAVFPTFTLATPQRLWTGRFQPPSSAPLSAGYGEFLRLGDGSSAGRSAGVDYAAAAGDSLTSPAAGTIVYAGTLSLTGGTVIIDHGAGLKSYFYHLGEVSCQMGGTVKAGDIVGRAGEQGAHYEARIGNQSIDPMQLFEGTSGLYWPED